MRLFDPAWRAMPASITMTFGWIRIIHAADLGGQAHSDSRSNRCAPWSHLQRNRSLSCMELGDVAAAHLQDVRAKVPELKGLAGSPWRPS
jgi:hypothetical protein